MPCLYQLHVHLFMLYIHVAVELSLSLQCLCIPCLGDSTFPLGRSICWLCRWVGDPETKERQNRVSANHAGTENQTEQRLARARTNQRHYRSRKRCSCPVISTIIGEREQGKKHKTSQNLTIPTVCCYCGIMKEPDYLRYRRYWFHQCLFVSLFATLHKTTKVISFKLFEQVGHDPMKNPYKFRVDSN